MNARIDWGLPWREIPSRDKANLCEIVSLLVSDGARLQRLTEE